MSSRKQIPPHARMVFKGVIFEVWQWEQEMFDGSTATFERLKRANTTQVIATVGDKILVNREMQPDSAAIMPSIPGGRCDEGEAPLDAAKRELLEETGYASDDWELWKETNPVGKIEWTIYTYMARNCRKVAEPHLDAGEKIESKLVTFDDFLALADDPDFYSPDIVPEMLHMKLDPSKKEAFRELLFGN